MKPSVIAGPATYHLRRGDPAQEGRCYPGGEEWNGSRPMTGMGTLTSEMAECERAYDSDLAV